MIYYSWHIFGSYLYPGSFSSFMRQIIHFVFLAWSLAIDKLFVIKLNLSIFKIIICLNAITRQMNIMKSIEIVLFKLKDENKQVIKSMMKNSEKHNDPVDCGKKLITGGDIINKFKSRQLCYAEIEHSDWRLQVTWLVFTNQSAFSA